MDEFPTQSAQYLHLMNLLQIPAITIFFYDWALTLGDEVELVWVSTVSARGPVNS